VDVHATFDAPVTPEQLFAVVADIATAPEWLGIADRVRPAASDPGYPGPAWSVDLRAQFGPLRRSKRLRMVRELRDEPRHIRWVRRELDARSHSAWTIDARCAPSGDGAHLSVDLHYGGTLWVPMLDRLLRDEIEQSRPRLLELLHGGHAGDGASA